MTVTVPTKFETRAQLGGDTFAARDAIYTGTAAAATDGFRVVVENATWVYANANRRCLLSYGCIGHTDDLEVGRNPLLTTASSYEIIFEVPFTASTDTASWAWTARGINIDILVTCFRDSLKVATADTSTFATTDTTTEQNIASTGTYDGEAAGLFEVKIKITGATTGQLFVFELHEVELTSGGLP